MASKRKRPPAKVLKFRKPVKRVPIVQRKKGARKKMEKHEVKVPAKAPEVKQVKSDVKAETEEAKKREEGQKKVEGLGKGLREHLDGVMKKHVPADPNLPSPTEIAIRALSLRCLQLLTEAEALAAQVALYEVPEEDEEKRTEAKKQQAAKPKEQGVQKEQAHG